MVSYLFVTEIDAPCLLDYTLYFDQSLLLCDVSNWFNHQTFSAPEQRSGCRPQGGAKEGGSRRMSWELVAEDVVGKPTDLSSAKVEREWKRRKHKMEKASRGSWTENENTPRAVQLRQYTLKEFWEIFVDDGPSGADAFFRHVNVQPKAVFSCAMTLMDKIQGWEEQEKRLGFQFATCMWIYTKKAMTKEQIPNPAMEEHLKKRMLCIMLCTNRVCAGTFVDHEWVSESTISQITSLIFRAWYNGAYCGFQHLRY